MSKEQTTADRYAPEFEAGYRAGLAGADIHEAEGWREAWKATGQNLPMYIMAGWMAGRAMRRIKQETGSV